MVKGVINATKLANQIASHMREYADITREEVDTIAEQVAKRGALKLKSVGEFGEYRGMYRLGWRAKKLDTGAWVVHNLTDYRLTHLLEKGHALDKGGRAKAFPHIGEVEQELIQEFERELREALSR